jgi:hypothetical protein
MKIKNTLNQLHHLFVTLTFAAFAFSGSFVFAQPANDQICSAIAVTCGSTTNGTTNGALNAGQTNENFTSCGGYTQNTPAVWYVFAGTGDIVTFSLCSSAVFNDSELGVYSGTSCSSATCLGANDDNGPSCAGVPSQASIAIPTTVGTNYYVKVFSWNQLTPNFNFTLTLSCAAPPTPPANDQICGALQMGCSSNNIYSAQTTTAATIGGYGETGICSGQSQNSPAVWYKVLGTGASMTIDLCTASPFDSQIAVYSSVNGTCPNATTNPLTCVTANDDFGPACATLQASVSFQSQVGVWYWVKVWRWSWIYNPNLVMGSFQINLTCSFSGPPNDPCSGATPVGVPYNSGIVSVAQATTATDGTVPTSFTSIQNPIAGTPTVCGTVNANMNNTLWYSVVGDGTTYTASTINASTNFDTEIQVFTGTCGALTGVACSNSTTATAACTNQNYEEVVWCTQPGVTYYVMVGSEFLNCVNSNFILTINSSAVPSTATLYNNDMVWRGGAGVPSTKTSYPYAYDTGEDWNRNTNWFVYDSINNSFIPSTGVPTIATNVYIPKLGGCNTKLPIIYNGTTAFAKNLTIMKDARLTFAAFTGSSITPGSLELKGDLNISGQLTSGTGSVTSISGGNTAVAAPTNAGRGLVKFTGSNNQTITYAELNPAGAPVNGNVNFYDLEINISGTNTGLVLNLPVYLFNDLKMTQGNILTSSTNFIVLGMHNLCPLIVATTYPSLALNWYGTPANPLVTTVTWASGSIVGPMFRYNRTNTVVSDANSLYPVGGMTNGNITNRNAYLKWATVGPSNSVGLLRARYIPGAVPFTAGMNLTDGSVTLALIGSEGYWEIHPYSNFTTPLGANLPNTPPNYNLSLRANQYSSISANYLDSRIIKAPGSPTGAPTAAPSAWILNGTHFSVAGQSTDFTVTRNGMSAFSLFAIAVPPLPQAVEFLGASHECRSGSVDFEWATVSENNSDHFIIETSNDGTNWTVYGIQQSAGNSTQRTDYRTVLPEPINDLYYVRLTELDMDGTESVLGVFAISCSDEINMFTYPNPSGEEFILTINDPKLKGEFDLTVTNALGARIAEQKGLVIEGGTANFSLNFSNLSPGVYYITATKEEYVKTIRHVVK